MAHPRALASIIVLALLLAGPLAAQEETAAAEDPDAAAENALLSDEDLQTLVAPVALYPDTLLIQVLVASTYPLDIVKADAFLDDNPDAEAGSLDDTIAAKGWDESVTVLATAFPDVLSDMADHVDWTDTMGTAMLAQSDDVMDAVQFKREQAQDAGTLTSNDQQTVEVTQEGDAGDTIIIQPSDPEVVYVPQYDPEVVYVDNGLDAGDAVAAGLITFATFAVIDEIFDNDDPWNNYWGCRNCGGWNGRPIVNNPNVDIDIDGDVNIGNRPDIGWKPDDKRRDDARDKISNRRGEGAASTLPVKKPDRGDQMRQSLSQRTGTQDISRDRAAANRVAGQVERPQVNRPGGLSQADRTKVADRTKAAPRPAGKPQVNRPQAKKPAAAPKRPSVKQKPARKAAPNRGAAMHKSAPASRAKAGSARGKAAAGGHSRSRR